MLAFLVRVAVPLSEGRLPGAARDETCRRVVPRLDAVLTKRAMRPWSRRGFSKDKLSVSLMETEM